MPRRADTEPLGATGYAVLGQLALRPWSGYELTKNLGRTLHWFWPRAESVLYAEIKRLAVLGLARTTESAGKRGRPTTVYTITAAGRRALARWLRTEPQRMAFHFEALLRVHLAPYGSKADLVRALAEARDEAEQLLRTAIIVGTEFVERKHQFQHQVHLRAILFDFLWQFGMLVHRWASQWLAEVKRWPNLDRRDRLDAEARALITRALGQSPLS